MGSLPSDHADAKSAFDAFINMMLAPEASYLETSLVGYISDRYDELNASELALFEDQDNAAVHVSCRLFGGQIEKVLTPGAVLIKLWLHTGY